MWLEGATSRLLATSGDSLQDVSGTAHRPVSSHVMKTLVAYSIGYEDRSQEWVEARAIRNHFLPPPSFFWTGSFPSLI